MFHLGLISGYKITVLSKESQVEVIVIVGDKDLSLSGDSNTNGVIGNTFTADLAQIYTIVVEYLKE